MAAMAARDPSRVAEQREPSDSASGSDGAEDLSVTQDLIARRLRRGTSDPTQTVRLSQRKLEEKRLRLELVSVPNDFQLGSLPPSGREFDPVPDPSDESAYDALEKAYNLAFAVSPPERLKRTAEVDELCEQRDAIEPINEANNMEHILPRVLMRKRQAIEREELSWANETRSHWKHEEVSERRRLMEKLGNHCQLGNSNSANKTSDTSYPRGKVHVALNGSPSVLDRAKAFASTRATRLQLLQHLAEACRSRVLGRSRMRHHVDNGYIRPSTLPLSLQIPPQLTEGQAQLQPSPNDEPSDTTHQECKAVAEFLVTQLTLFAGCLTHGHQGSAKNRKAALASHQLWRDQQRALADSELNSMRRSNRRVWFDESMRNEVHVQQLNPFQQAGEVFEAAWKTSLKRVEYGDWQLGLRADSCSSRLRESAVNRELQNLYTRGLNAILVHRGDGARSEVASFLFQIQNVHALGHIHLVITKQSCIPEWDRTLTSEGIVVLPLCGKTADRHRVQSVAEGKKKNVPRVVLYGIEAIGQDISALAVLPLHLCIFDIDFSVKNSQLYSTPSVWMSLMSMKCRQRVLLSQPTSYLDVRELALFAYPAALCSRRKILAWNCASLSTKLVSSIIDAVKLCTVFIDNDKGIITEWNTNLETTTVKRVQREERTLDILTRDVAAYSLGENAASPLMRLYQPEIEMPTVDTKKKMTRRDIPVVSMKVDPVYVKKVPTKRRRRSSKSRKRISRCGECAGCVAEDCMKCGHCQDMKKYGGPGLRKQSCKRRKCLNPKTWGLKRKKTARYEDASLNDERDGNVGESSEVGSSDQDSVVDGDHGDNSISSSGDSDDDSTIVKGDPSVPTYDSDSNVSSHLGEENGASIPGDIFDNADVSDIDEPNSEGGSYSRAGRSRVMRCGKCRGCTSGDCMKCIHCQDMKKYGGPGLRKQSCKNRKCIAPKVVILNRMREKQDTGADEVIVGEHPPADDDLRESQQFVDIDVADLLHSTVRLDTLDVVQECALVVRKFQFFRCDVCLRTFTSQKLLDLHIHGPQDDESSDDRWEQDAEDGLLHPAQQLACLLSSRRSINPNWQAPRVRAYAKLEGAGFEYYFLKPFAILGRISGRWNEFYTARGMTNRKGLSGGTVDCHLGDDGMIANRHALIRWDHTSGFFTIECLSFRSSLSVNGRDVHYSSLPLRLRSQDLIQIGATTVYFLLPMIETSHAAARAPPTPRTNVCAWLNASLTKRRASTAQDEAIRQEMLKHH